MNTIDDEGQSMNRETTTNGQWCFQLFAMTVALIDRRGCQVKGAKVYQVKDVQEAHDLCESLNAGAKS
jgi:hypothetical protein